MKTIEEAIEQLKQVPKEAEDLFFSIIERDLKLYKEARSSFYSLPLSDRLTAEEREKIKGIYADAHPEDPGRSFASLCVTRSLEDIFGKEMFAEEGGSNENIKQ